jgi:DNA polymerase-3 subunit epsilon
MDELIILDFETTGLSPDYARIIEVGAVLIKGDKIVDKTSQLLYPGSSIPYFITEITGITNQMVKGQPRPEQFMPTLRAFIGNRPILAHNALFDQKFLISEMNFAGIQLDNPFLCTLKLARRLVDNALNYKLTTLVSHLNIKVPKDHRAHRALNDVIMTFHVWSHLKQHVTDYINAIPDLDLFFKLSSQPKNKILKLLDNHKKSLLIST